jgi:type VI secretion system secreted protein Hcp
MSASDFFLKIDGIPGESMDSKHKDQIDIQSFSWGETNMANQSSGGGGGAGKVSFQDFHFTANVNKSSPIIAYHCASGKHITKAEVIARKQGDKQQDYYLVTLTDVVVSSYQSHGGASIVPSESYSFAPAKVEWEYKVQKSDGSLDKGAKFGWDIKKNEKV